MPKREKRLKAVLRLDDVEIINQERCYARWDDMEGNDTVRRCTYCQLNVYNFARMSPEEICNAINTHEGRLCAQFYARPDGTMMLEPCSQRATMLRGRVAVREI